MADGGLPAPPGLPALLVPQPSPLTPPIQPIVPHAQTISAEPIQPAYIPQLNWSHFKTEYAGKPDEDAEAQLLRMNDWMNTHAFPEGVKSPMFLSNISRRGNSLIYIIKNYKCILNQVTKSV